LNILAGDIGGTKTTMAVFEQTTEGLLEVEASTYPSGQYPSLEAIVKEFFGQSERRCDFAGFGIAGPVRDGRCKTTNLPWQIDALELAASCDLQQAWLANDLEANAWGISTLTASDFAVLNAGIASASGHAGVVSAGTGLGLAGLYWDGHRHLPFASEGGHADFAPANDLDVALFTYLQEHHGHVSWERVVSGMGLVTLYNFMCHHLQRESSDERQQAMRDGDKGAVISSAAQAGECDICVQTMALFVRQYGAIAGNHALNVMATGGIYIGGGIAPKILAALQQPAFMNAFQDKGRMRPLLQDIPVKVILNERTALRGAAEFALSRVE
jgi:glucokinase